MTDWRGIPGNEAAFERLVHLVGSREAVAFVGAGASAALYPTWPQLLEGLITLAVKSGKAEPRLAERWRARAATRPLDVARAIRGRLRGGRFFDFLHETFKPRGEPPHTATHAALVRLPFRAFVTTNYDNGLRLARPAGTASAEPFTWKSSSVSRWLQNGPDGVPILHAHGLYSEADSLVLDRDRYREAYAHAPFVQLLEQLWTGGRLVVVGFGFSDPWLEMMVDKVIERSGVRPVTAPGHVAILALNEDEVPDADMLREELEDIYHQNVLFYTARGSDHSVLSEILAELARRFQVPALGSTPLDPEKLASDPLPAYFRQVATDHRRLADHFDRPAELQVLEKAWVRLELARHGEAGAEHELLERAKAEAERPRAGRPDRASLDDFLALDPTKHTWVTGRWLVEGEPGAGKTTLLRRLAARLAVEAQAERVPLFLPLPKLVDPFRLPLDYLEEEYRAFCGGELSATLEQAGADGRLVVLLDSYDEVPPERRERVDRLVAYLEDCWPSCLVVLSSRPIGLGEPPPSFRKLSLQPLDDEQRRTFLEKWLRSRAIADPEAEAERALEHFDSERSLRELSHNPLHLTLLTVLWEKGVEAPRRRSALYEAIFELLLEGRHKKPPRPIAAQADVREALRHLAFGQTEDDRPSEEPEELERRLLEDDLDATRHRLEKTWGRGQLRRFLDTVFEQTWILGPHDGPRSPWRFWHRTFREALVAEHLEEKLRSKGERTLFEHARRIEGDEGRWAEPYALLVGHLPVDSDPGPDALVQTLMRTNQKLGLRALATAQGLKRETIDALLEELARSDSGDAAAKTESWEARAAVYRRIPELLGDPRAALDLLGSLRRRTRNGNDLFFLELAMVEVGRRWEQPEVAQQVKRARGGLFEHVGAPPPGLFEEISIDGKRKDLWKEIPAGSFQMGRGAHEGKYDEKENPLGGWDDELPQHEVVIASRFRIAVVPVTNAQYRAFDPSHEPHRWKGVSEAELEDHPAVNVTWYQAVTFCRWLMRYLPGVRLATEEDWEYACRAGETTRYWSGDEEQDLGDVGWYGSNSDGRSHRVGEKRASPWGLYDMHGNVWEWTQSPWADDYSDRQTGREVDFSTNSAASPADLAGEGAATPGGWRVIRGGSFGNPAYGARAAYRDGRLPRLCYLYLGFRLVCPAARPEP